MTDKELQRLRREDLLQILISQQKQIQDLTEALDSAEAALKDRQIKLDNAGSIAEAALQLNGVFEAAQQAVDDYQAQARKRADEMLAEADQKLAEAARRLSEADEEVRRRIAEADAKNAEMQARLAQARSDAETQADRREQGEAPRKRIGLFGRGKRT